MRLRSAPRVFVTCAVVTGLIALAPMATDTAIPALPAIGRALQASPDQVVLIISLFYFGMALMQLVYGPLSDHYGRRTVLVISLVIYLAATAGIVLATSIEMLLALRVLQAGGACAGTVLGRAIVRDMFERNEAGRVLGYCMTAMTIVPGISPIIGGELLVAFGWRSVFGLTLVIGAIIAFFTWRILPETLPPARRQPANLDAIVRAFAQMARHREYLGFVLAACGSSVALFAYLSGAGYTYVDVLGLEENLVGWMLLLAVGGYLVGGFSGSGLQRRFGLERIVLAGLVLNILGGALMAIGLVTGSASIWFVALPGIVVFAGNGAALPQATAGALGPFPHVAGTASSLVGFCQMLTGAAASALVGTFYDGSPASMVIAITLGPLVGLVLYGWLIRPWQFR
ncbi:MAG: multidrug effflux MFS transporter [Rhodospirillales bacterium]|nr:multidrug effflux MFS transporter [Rhodospirillales bacterium]